MLTKDQLRDVAAMFLVYLHRDAPSIVPHADGALLLVDGHFDRVSLLVTLDVVGSINQYLICSTLLRD